MRQMRIGILLGAALALCTGMAFASSEHRAEAPKYEQGYGYTEKSTGFGASDLVAIVAESPRLREKGDAPVSVLLNKRTSSKMIAKSGHFQALEVAAVTGNCSACKIGVGEG